VVLPLDIHVVERAVPKHERERVCHLIFRFPVDDREVKTGPGRFAPVDIAECRDGRWWFKSRAHQKEDGHDVPNLMVEECVPDEVQDVKLVVVFSSLDYTVRVWLWRWQDRVDLRAEDPTTEVGDLFRWIELGEVPEVVFADEVVCRLLHAGDVEAMGSEEVFVVPVSAVEPG